MGRNGVYLCFLAVHAITDLREKRIYVAVLMVQALVGMLFWLCGGYTGPAAMLSCMPGLFCLAAGKLSGEKIGCGDGWMILLGGLYLSAGQLMGQLLLSFLAACVYVVWQLAAGKMSGEEEIPFAPFFLAGYLGGALYGQG